MKIKLKHIEVLQCLLVSFTLYSLLVSLTLYMFREWVIPTLPVWLITLPIWLPLALYYLVGICIYIYRVKHPKKINEETTLQDKYDALVYRNMLLEAEISNLKSSRTEILKSDKEINLEGLKWMWSKPPEILTQNTHFEIAQSDGYNNSRNSETYSNLKEAVLFAKIKRNKGDMYDDSWNSKNEIITKVTTIKEIMAVVRAEEKI